MNTFSALPLSIIQVFFVPKSPTKRKCFDYDPAIPTKLWRRAWESLTEKAGLKGLRFHDLRRHSITRLAEKGVMAIAGNVSKEMLEHYSHTRMQAKREAVAALEPPNLPATDQKQCSTSTIN